MDNLAFYTTLLGFLAAVCCLIYKVTNFRTFKELSLVAFAGLIVGSISWFGLVVFDLIYNLVKP